MLRMKLIGRFTSLAIAFACLINVSGVAAQGGKGQNPDTNKKVSKTLKSGYLKNGIKYYIQYNPAPANRAAIWLAVNAGSIQEDEDQLGFAHYLEHMAFNGTKKFPGNTLIDVIEQSGMTFGADLNAYTSFDETVYQLFVPTDNNKYLVNGVDIIHEWASGAMLMDSMDVVMERGVVLGEWRQRFIDTLQYRQFKEFVSRSMGANSKYKERLPIGSDKLLKSANPGPLKRFYNDWYRPDLMSVIVVGDVDPDEMYKLVKDRFESIPVPKTKRQYERVKINYDSIAPVSIVKDIVRPSVNIQWRVPKSDTSKEVVIRNRAIESIIVGHLNEMFGRYAKMERRPFAFASMGRASHFSRSVDRMVEINIAMAPDSIEHAISYALNEIEKIAQSGILESDLLNAKAILLRSWQRGADRENVVTSRALATAYVEDFLSGDEPIVNPGEQLEIGSKILNHITMEDIQAAAAFWRNTSNRYVTVQIPRFANVNSPSESKIENMMTPAAIAGYVAAHPIDLPSRTSVNKPSSQQSIGSGSERVSSGTGSNSISSESYDEIANIHTWKLINGARVIFKQTNYNPDELIIHAISPGGFSKLPDHLRMSSGRLIADLMTASGSAGAKDRTQFVDSLRRSGLTNFSVVLSGFTEEMVVAGSSRQPSVLFETMYRQFTDPHIDSVALAEWKRSGMRSITYSQLDNIAYSLTGDRRLAPPSVINVPFMNVKQGMEVYKDRFGDASDFTFFIVGAISEDSLRKFVSHFIATLPSTNRTTPESIISTKVQNFHGKVATTVQSPGLQAVQAVANIGFRGHLTASNEAIMGEQDQLWAVSWILSRRLRNKLREEMAVTYGAGAQSSAVPIPAWYYNIGIQFMTSPEDINRSVDSTWSVINELKANGPTMDELDMAFKIQRRLKENAQHNNNWWISQLSLYDRMGIPFRRLIEDDVKELSVEQYKQQIRKFLPEDSYLQTITLPTEETIKEYKKDES